jgi:hypothetical protein
MIDIDERPMGLECEVCADHDHCLPRWEDDGGGTPRPPSLARASQETTGRDHGRVVHPCNLTSRDIETEVLSRLASKGYDWSGTLGRRQRAP